MDREDPTTVQGVLFDEARKNPRRAVPLNSPLCGSSSVCETRPKAKQEPEFRFYALYGHLLRVDVLETAYATVAASNGSRTPGVDGVTIDQIVSAEGGATAFLTEFREELRARTYDPQPVKRVWA